MEVVGDREVEMDIEFDEINDTEFGEIDDPFPRTTRSPV